jgi:hypothetical protein
MEPKPCAGIGLQFFSPWQPARKKLPANISRLKVTTGRDPCPDGGAQARHVEARVHTAEGEEVAAHIEPGVDSYWLVFDDTLSEFTRHDVELACWCNERPEEPWLTKQAFETTPEVPWPQDAGRMTGSTAAHVRGNNGMAFDSCGTESRLTRQATITASLATSAALAPFHDIAEVTLRTVGSDREFRTYRTENGFEGKVTAICESDYATPRDLVQGKHKLYGVITVPGLPTLETAFIPVDLRCPTRFRSYAMMSAAALMLGLVGWSARRRRRNEQRERPK